MSSIIIVLAIAAAAFAAVLVFRKKPSQPEEKQTFVAADPVPVAPVAPEELLSDKQSVEAPAAAPVKAPVATVEQKAKRKTNATKQGAAKKSITKKVK